MYIYERLIELLIGQIVFV